MDKFTTPPRQKMISRPGICDVSSTTATKRFNPGSNLFGGKPLNTYSGSGSGPSPAEVGMRDREGELLRMAKKLRKQEEELIAASAESSPSVKISITPPKMDDPSITLPYIPVEGSKGSSSFQKSPVSGSGSPAYVKPITHTMGPKRTLPSSSSNSSSPGASSEAGVGMTSIDDAEVKGSLGVIEGVSKGEKGVEVGETRFLLITGVSKTNDPRAIRVKIEEHVQSRAMIYSFQKSHGYLAFAFFNPEHASTLREAIKSKKIDLQNPCAPLSPDVEYNQTGMSLPVIGEEMESEEMGFYGLDAATFEEVSSRSFFALLRIEADIKVLGKIFGAAAGPIVDDCERVVCVSLTMTERASGMLPFDIKEKFNQYGEVLSCRSVGMLDTAFVVEFADSRHAMRAAQELHGVTTEGVHLLTSVYRKPIKPASPSDANDASMDSAMLVSHFTKVHHVRRPSDGEGSPMDNSPGSYKPLGTAYENTPSSMTSLSASKGMFSTPTSMYSSSHSGTGYRLLTPHTPSNSYGGAQYPDPAYSTPTRRRTLADLADSTYITPTEYAIRSVQRQTAKYQTLNDHLLSTPGPRVRDDDLFYYWNGTSPSKRGGDTARSAPVSPEQRRNTISSSTGRLPSFNPLKHSQLLTLADWRKTTGQIKGQGSLKYVQEVPPDYRLTLENLESGRDHRLTVMIKDIPNKLTRDQLIEVIQKTVPGGITFAYLRFDWEFQCNVAYGFVNFRSLQDLTKFAKARLGQKWGCFMSEKVLQMSYATIQGHDALVNHFRNSTVMHTPEDWRPVVLNEDGDIVPFPPPNKFRYKHEHENEELRYTIDINENERVYEWDEFDAYTL